MHPLPASHHKLMVPPLAQRARQTLLLLVPKPRSFTTKPHGWHPYSLAVEWLGWVTL